MVEGRLRKYLAEITLLGQQFVKDQDITVEKLLKKAGAKVTMFVRYEVGAGIEKKQDDFVGEVMAQVKAQDKDKSANGRWSQKALSAGSFVVGYAHDATPARLVIDEF